MTGRKVLVDTLGSLTRRVVLEDGIPVEYAIERRGQPRPQGSLYLGRVVNVLPGMQAAFVDIGLEKNAFLPMDDAPSCVSAADEARVGARSKASLRQGQEIIVQVVKEPGGDKGPRVTMHPTFPGKYAVLLPTVEALGVSRHIVDAGRRAMLLTAARAACPEGMGLVIRTAAADVPEESIVLEARALFSSWEAVLAMSRTSAAPALLMEDGGLLSGSSRDLNADIVEGSLDEALEAKLEKALSRKVWLPCGGFLLFDRTEAMTVIDVNSGKYTGRRSLGDTVRRLNAEAAREIARLIRLRDIGGIIVVDFVDMETEEDRRAVLAALREVLARDRAKHHVYGFTGAGLLEMTRRPVFMPVEETLFTPCGRCLGKGMLPSADAGALALRREVRRRRAAGDESEISLDAPEDVIRALRAGGVPERVRLRSAGGAV